MVIQMHLDRINQCPTAPGKIAHCFWKLCIIFWPEFLEWTVVGAKTKIAGDPKKQKNINVSFNPFTPRSDQYVVSPYINTFLTRDVMRKQLSAR